MKLYFTADAKIDPEHSVLFNQVAINIHKSFVDAVESLSGQNKDSIDWWVSSPASRNTSVSPLFHYCCCLALLQELIRANEHFTEIITDSRAFKKIIEDYLVKHGVNARVTLPRLPLKQYLKELVRPIYTIFGIPLRHLLVFFITRQAQPLHKPLPSEPLTLIDTFVMPGYIEKDRYYPGVLEALSESEKQRVWFVPHLYGFRPWQYLSLVKQLRKSGRNFLLKDDFMKFGDYWCLWQYLFRVRKLQIKPSFFCGVDISPLVREELTGFRGVSSSYTPLLNYCFAKRLQEADVKLRLVIKWFENQNNDRGWNAGFRRFFPDVEIIGYQGFIPPPAYCLHLYQTDMEKDSGVIPHKVAVIGKGLIQSARKFCSDLDVCVAPAFRFQHVWRKRKYSPATNRNTIFVTLSIVISEAVYMLKLLVSADSEMVDNARFWIKPHPATSQLQIQRAFGAGWPEQFEFMGGDFGNCIEKSNLLISSASSACMETLAKGIPVIIIGNNCGLTQNPIPETITEDIWRLCYSPEEVTDAIQFYQTRSPEKIKEHEEIGKRIREEYFEPVTREGVRDFLGLSEGKYETYIYQKKNY